MPTHVVFPREHQATSLSPIKRRMRSRLLPLVGQLLLRKRVVSESLVDQLKNILHLEHSRHRSVANCCVKLLGGLIAYRPQAKEPALHLSTFSPPQTA